MKKGLFLFSVLMSTMFGLQVYAQQTTGPVISVNKETHNYGNIAYKANGVCEFTIKNTGNEPLQISDAKGSCGCTVPDYPKTPIAPGASATIKVTYDTSRSGYFKKSVTITSNASNEPSKVVYIEGTVAANPDAPAPNPVPNTTTPAPNPQPKTGSGSATLTTPK